METLPYDRTSAKSIETYAKKLIGHTFLDVLEGDFSRPSIVADAVRYGNKRRKGGLGNLLEEEYFGYSANSISAADFEEAGVELKVTPYEKNRNGEFRAGERLVLSMIDYSKEIGLNLFDSHLWEKCRLLLLIFYFRDRALKNNLLYPIHYVSLFSPSPTDLVIIENDYRMIAEKISAGKADELSEADTYYLGACTKGTTAESSMVSQFYPPYNKAKKRAFCYKNSYMSFVLNEYFINKRANYESIVKDCSELKGLTFAQYIIAKINRFKGYSDRKLCQHFNREYNNNKAQWTDLSYRMLGIKSNFAEEFKKSNIVVKVIRLEEDGKMLESLSFPPFKFKEIIKQSWNKSDLYNYFYETKFLFVVFKRAGKEYILRGCQFWNMPYRDLNSEVKEGWIAVVNTIRNGIKFSIKKSKNGIIVNNNLPKKANNSIIHVRPHARKRYYQFLDGTIVGNGTRADANQLPDGTWMPNQSFWVNNDYILKQLLD